LRLKENLKKLLKSKSITVSDLSREVGISVKTLHNWTTGQEPNKLTQVKKVADYFEMSIDEICFSGRAELNSSSKSSAIEMHQDEIKAGIFEVVLRPIKK